MNASNVVDLFPSPPSPNTRELRYRRHHQLPAASLAIDRLEFRIEQQLIDLGDQGLDPFEFLPCFSVADASLLEAVFDAADAAAEAEMRQHRVTETADAYQDAIYDLAEAVRAGVR